MRIDRLGIALRARTSWEAVDLGIALARQHASDWLVPWLVYGAALFALLLAGAHAVGHSWLAPLALWWLKPTLDRVPLYVLSRAVFGHRPTRAEIYRAAWGWGWGPTLPRLLWLRFDPFRALSMPSDLLEGLPRAERSQRRRLLRREGAAQAAGLWLLLPAFETVLLVSAWSLVALMIPPEWWTARGEHWLEVIGKGEAFWLDLASNLVIGFSLLAIEPFFVAAGFGLYLSRRVHLEAWDLELGFKRMAARATAAGRGMGAMLALLLAIGLAAPVAEAADAVPDKSAKPEVEASADAPWKPRKSAPPSALPADFGGADAATVARFDAALRNARDDASLGGVETVERWRPKDLFGEVVPEEQRDPFREWQARFGKWVGQVLGLGAEALLWLLAIALIAFLLYRYRDWLPWRREHAGEAHEPPPLVHRGLAPEDVAAAPELLRRARAAWARGATREAFACLYRAGLREVSVRRPRPLPPGTTEGQLLRAARELASAPAREHVRRLVQAWRGVAYAGERPDAAAFEALITAWPAAFGEVRA